MTATSASLERVPARPAPALAPGAALLWLFPGNGDVWSVFRKEKKFPAAQK